MENQENLKEAQAKSEHIYETIREFLPDIENELRKEITQELEEDYRKKFEELLIQTKEDTRKEIDSIITEIKQEAFSAYNERVKALEEKEAEILELRNEYKGFVEQEIKEELRVEFEKEKDLLLKTLVEEMGRENPLQEQEIKLKEKIQRELEEDMKKELLRKEKLMNVNMRKKIDQEKKAVQETYELEWRNKIEDAKKEVERERIEINRLKSLENIRLKKLEEEKKAFRKEMELQKKHYEEEINELNRKIAEFSRNQNSFVNNKSNFKKKEKQEVRGIQEEDHDHDFEKKYLQKESNHSNTKKSHLNSPNLNEDHFFSKEEISSCNNRLEQMIEPLSPPKLLYFDEESVISYEKNHTISGEQIQEQNIEILPNKTETHISNKRTLIGEYNSKQIAEDIIRMYTERRAASIKESQDLSKIVSKSIHEQQFPKDLTQTQQFSVEESNKKSEFIGGSSSALKERTLMNQSQTAEKSFFLNEREQMRNESKSKRIEEFSMKYNQMLNMKGNNNPNNSNITLNNSNNSKIAVKTYETNNNYNNNTTNYKEIIKKYIKNNAENQDNKRFVIEDNNRINKYESLFLIGKTDDAKLKEMKKLRKDVFTKILRDCYLEEKYLAMEIYLKNQMLKSIKCQNIEFYGLLQRNFNILLETWNLNDVSYKERIEFISNLENLLGEGEEISKRVENEIDFLQNHYKISFNIIEKLKERMVLRSKLNVEDFTYTNNKKLFTFLRNLCLQLEELLYEYEETQGKAFIWRGVNVQDILKCEQWEQEYLEKDEMKKEIYSRIKKKIL